MTEHTPALADHVDDAAHAQPDAPQTWADEPDPALAAAPVPDDDAAAASDPGDDVPAEDDAIGSPEATEATEASAEVSDADMRAADAARADDDSADDDEGAVEDEAGDDTGDLADHGDDDAEDSDDGAEDFDDEPGADDEAGAAAPSRSGQGRRAHLEREGEVAADFLESLLDIADLDGDIDLDVDGDRAAVAIVDSDEGRVPRRLVGPGGKVLDALQELTRLAVQSATGERSRLMLDIAGFRAERRAALAEQARVAIDECRRSGAPVDLTPMSAFERKVVHDEVLAAGLISESSGVEPRRYVVVKPAG